MGKERVWLIEDDRSFAFLAKIIIEEVDRDIDTIIFINGAVAIEHLEAHIADPEQLPHLIFLDINMPVMDAWGFLTAYEGFVTKLPVHIPIYVLSSSIAESDMTRAKSNPLVVDFISKPFDEAGFRGILSALRSGDI